MIQNVTNSNFEFEVLESDKPSLVYFTATWCGPCRVISPLVDRLADEFKGRVNVVKADIEDAADVAKKYNIRGVPTFVFIKQGAEVDRHIGGNISEETLRQVLTILS